MHKHDNESRTRAHTHPSVITWILIIVGNTLTAGVFYLALLVVFS